MSIIQYLSGWRRDSIKNAPAKGGSTMSMQMIEVFDMAARKARMQLEGSKFIEPDELEKHDKISWTDEQKQLWKMLNA